MSSPKPTIAFFGATGGCAINTLALALKDGYQISALVRTPQKLHDMLEKNHAIPAKTIESNLHIVQGSSTDAVAVKKALVLQGVPAPIIISGVGGTPKLNASLSTPVTLDQPTICEDTSVAILSALKELRHEGVLTEAQKPIVIAISTTGLENQKDVPCLIAPFYHKGLKVPHMDKQIMERNFVAAALQTGDEAVLNNFIFVRPSLLMDGEPKGMDALRVGWVHHDDAPYAAAGDAPGPAVGSTIRRVDVGTWMFENAVKDPAEWKGKCVSLTY